MYAGPMKRIAYDYKPLTPTNPDGTTPVYGQILSERYWDGTLGHEHNGAAVSTLTVGESPNITYKYHIQAQRNARGQCDTQFCLHRGGVSCLGLRFYGSAVHDGL